LTLSFINETLHGELESQPLILSKEIVKFPSKTDLPDNKRTNNPSTKGQTTELKTNTRRRTLSITSTHSRSISSQNLSYGFLTRPQKAQAAEITRKSIEMVEKITIPLDNFCDGSLNLVAGVVNITLIRPLRSVIYSSTLKKVKKASQKEKAEGSENVCDAKFTPISSPRARKRAQK
ncbi:hypothetical protein HK096_009852, partial [Nowakowskiella sp. JEL0078]